MSYKYSVIGFALGAAAASVIWLLRLSAELEQLKKDTKKELDKELEKQEERDRLRQIEECQLRSEIQHAQDELKLASLEVDRLKQLKEETEEQKQHEVTIAERRVTETEQARQHELAQLDEVSCNLTQLNGYRSLTAQPTVS